MPALFVDQTKSLRIDFTYYNNSDSGRYFNGETNGGGVAWLDYDGDDWMDLYLTNGCKLPRDPTDTTHVNRLYRNVEGSTFVDPTLSAGVGHNGFGHGVAVGDFDDDGWPDLYLANFGPDVLYRNNGDGTFSDVTAAAGTSSDLWNSSAAFGDLDRDGDLDLYVSTYARADLNHLPVCKSETYRVYCGPDYYPADPHVFFLNQGDGTFHDATSESGFLKIAGKGMGVVIADLDNDEWPDVFVANDKTPSYLFHNETGESSDKRLRVHEVGVESGVAFNGQGELVAGMGIACGDFDEDGLLDLFVTHYQREMDTMYHNLGRLVFADDTAAVGLGTPSLPYLGFGTEFIDYDNDGWLDLVVANGHVLGPAHWSYAMRPQLYRNHSGERFEEMTDQAGAHFREQFVGRGLAIADFDNDGGIEFAVINTDRPAYVVENACAARGHFARLRLVGLRANRSAINARVILHAGSRRLMREIVGGGSYQSASDQRISIGLGTLAGIDALEVVWPSGHVDRWGPMAADRQWLLIEGRTPL